MKMLFYEMRKTIFRKYMILVLGVLMVLNVVNSYIQYCQAGTGFSDIITKKQVSESQWEYYQQLHQKLDGDITKEKVEFVAKENSKMERAWRVGDSREVTENAGSVSADYTMISTNFYNPLKYMVNYKVRSDEITKKAKENISLYSEKNNVFEKERNQFIVNRYENRKLDTFFDAQGWKKLFEYDYSDLFIFMLLLLAIIPIYYNENKNAMSEIILTTKQWERGYISKKKTALVLWAVFLVMFFAICNYITFACMYGLPYATAKLFTIPEYEYTSLNVSLIGFYMIENVLKCLSLVFGVEILIIISRRIKNIYAIYLMFILLFVAGLFCSGYVCSSKPVETVIAIVNPLSGLKASEIYKQCKGVNLFNHYVPWVVAFLVLQMIISLIVHLYEKRSLSARRYKSYDS